MSIFKKILVVAWVIAMVTVLISVCYSAYHKGLGKGTEAGFSTDVKMATYDAVHSIKAAKQRCAASRFNRTRFCVNGSSSDCVTFEVACWDDMP